MTFFPCPLVSGLPRVVQAAEWHPHWSHLDFLKPLRGTIFSPFGGCCVVHSFLEILVTHIGGRRQIPKPCWFHMCHLQLLQTGLALQLVKHKLRQRQLRCFVTSFVKLRFVPTAYPLPQPCSCQSGGVCEDLLIIHLLHRKVHPFTAGNCSLVSHFSVWTSLALCLACILWHSWPAADRPSPIFIFRVFA